MVPVALIDELERRLQAASGPLRVAAVEAEVDPLALVRAGASGYGWSGYFSHEEFSIGALGMAQRMTASGPKRFDSLAVDAARLPAAAIGLVGFAYEESGPTDPLWQGFPAATVVVPRIAAVSGAGRSQLVAALPPGADLRSLRSEMSALTAPGGHQAVGAIERTLRARPGPGEWRRAVDEVIAAISDKAVSKVVLARSVDVVAPTAPAPFDVAGLLHRAHPQSHVFAWQEDSSVFVGASPELLLRRAGSTIVSRPMAGSAPRGDGEASDRAIGDRLLHSAKDLAEHKFVVDDMVARLAAVTEWLEVPAHPELMRLATVQHLATRLVGKLKTSASLLELVGALHPTPAVGGTPRAEAAAFIDKLEPVDRGWYAGGIGWADGAGDGEIAVALRCALMTPRLSRLYAGAGVVAQSDSDAELAETRLKLAPLLSVLATG